ncbi:MAG: MarR family transcriptional regulator [Bacteroidetes bacterium]|nr:MarR family transcriptional regulator [Bacteroidota bacterium]
MGKNRNNYPITGDLFGYLITMSQYCLREQYIDSLKPYNLTVPAWSVLVTLHQIDWQSDLQLQSVTQLRAITLLKQPTLTKILQRLEEDGYVERRTHEDDQRLTLSHITNKGRETVRNLLKKDVPKLESIAFAGFSSREQKQLKAMLTRVINNLITES